MNELIKIEHAGQRVLTTQQLAEKYGVESVQLQQNYLNNKDRYQTGIHFFKLEGQELREFKNGLENFEVVGSRINSLILWTEKGCLNHAKSLGTDSAWDVFNMLIDTYFRVKENLIALPKDYPSALRALADQVEENQKLIPKAESFDSLMNAEGLFSIEQAAKVMNYKDIGRNNLFKILTVEGMLFKRNNQHRVYQEFINRGYFKEKVTTVNRGDNLDPYVQIFITPKGIDWLDKHLKEKGYKKSA